MPYCTKCGNMTGERDFFCSSCGTRQAAAGYSAGPPPPPPPYPPPPFPPPPYSAPSSPSQNARQCGGQDPLGALSPRAASILCYVPTVGWIASVIMLAAKKFRNDQIVRFHAFQGLYLFAIWLLVQWVIHPLMEAGGGNFFRIDRLLSGVVMAVSIFMMVKASHGEAYALPIIGELAQRSAQER